MTGFAKVETPLADLDIPMMGESDLDYCKRIFGGEEFTCYTNGCHTKIYWPGVCDRCDERMKSENEKMYDAPKTIPEKLTKIGVPKGYSTWTWAGCKLPENAQRSALYNWGGDPPVMLITGPTGTGKTGVAVCMARDWVTNGKSVKWIYMPDWLDELRWLEKEGDALGVVQSVQNFKGLLIIDELASNRTTVYGLDRVLQVMDGRIREDRPTIVTSNLPPHSSSAHSGIKCLADLDERIASRVGSGFVVWMTGKDRRDIRR